MSRTQTIAFVAGLAAAVLVLGGIIMAAGTVVATIGAHHIGVGGSSWPIVPGLLIMGAGLSLLVIPLVNVVLAAVPAREAQKKTASTHTQDLTCITSSYETKRWRFSDSVSGADRSCLAPFRRVEKRPVSAGLTMLAATRPVRTAVLHVFRKSTVRHACDRAARLTA